MSTRFSGLYIQRVEQGVGGNCRQLRIRMDEDDYCKDFRREVNMVFDKLCIRGIILEIEAITCSCEVGKDLTDEPGKARW